MVLDRCAHISQSLLHLAKGDKANRVRAALPQVPGDLTLTADSAGRGECRRTPGMDWGT